MCLGDTALHMAVKYHRVGVLSLMLKDNDIDTNVENRNGDTPLHEAVKINCYDAVDLLLKHPRIDVNAKNYKGILHLKWHLCA